MFHSINTLHGCTIHATDGQLGTIDDVLFDDQHWTVRYVVVNTGSWLASRRVLISPLSIKAVHADARTIDVALTQQQVEQSPTIDTHQPVSRQHERALSQHYELPVYWGGPGQWGINDLPANVVTPQLAADSAPDSAIEELNDQGDSHLHSASTTHSYEVHARDEDPGHVADFLVDDANWALRYLVVDTGRWLPGKKVLLASQWIANVSWVLKSVKVDLSGETIKASAAYDPSASFSRTDETELYRYYGQPPYWNA